MATASPQSPSTAARSPDDLFPSPSGGGSGWGLLALGAQGTLQVVCMPYASPSEIKRARRLRTETTDAEARLWTGLRGKQIAGHRFRRQVPVGSFIADFACLKAHLIVEVDGSQHLAAGRHDDHRTAWLQSRGYRVLRFWDNDVLQRTESVLEAIRLALLEAPTLTLPQRGREIR